MTPEQLIEEAHGLWELAAQRVCALAELHINEEVALKLKEASVQERLAFAHWSYISEKCTTPIESGQL